MDAGEIAAHCHVEEQEVFFVEIVAGSPFVGRSGNGHFIVGVC